VPSTCTKDGKKTNLYINVKATVVTFVGGSPVYDIVINNVSLEDVNKNIKWSKFAKLVEQIVDHNIRTFYLPQKEK